ncbi:conserved oligomeric Golgi complex subunit 7 [Musca vetustissima]|uniref:conserved oligomeric Golgi complex subunit 7 n=1 Tax=Musca vetustissima TaxID=27455 RepID=UPI002AB64167|nr:conserved oligomeric Golgi complex subunit 7 [Musca vetustissima]
MDISALSEDKFDAVDWINENFKKYSEENKSSTAGGRNTDQTSAGGEGNDRVAIEFINSYVSKLQLYVQQVNYAVEESSQQLVASLPKIVKDVKALHTDVRALQGRMLEMRQEVAAVQEETGECMATLEKLNSKQIKLQTAKESLQESDGWGNLISQLEDSFEKNDLKSVCDKIAALQKSLQAQEQLPGHEDRKSQVEDFKNRLEALASPSLVQCFAEGNIEQAQRYVNIFAAIERKPQLLQYYSTVQKTALQQQWKQTLEIQATETVGQQQHFLNLFYDQLLENCQKQVKWCAQVFGGDEEAIQQPLRMLAELLPSLQPSRDNHILQLLKTCNERLELLQQFAQANHNFVLQLNAYLEQSSIELSEDLKQQLSHSIYEYFHKFIQQYPRLEETHLSTQVDKVLVSQSHASDAVRHLKDSTSKLFDWLHEALQRCNNITNDLALCKLINLLGGIFKRLLEQFAKTQRQLTLNIGSNANAANSDSNWSMLQYTLALLECLADYHQKLQKFEKTLQERLMQLKLKLEESPKKTLNIYQTFDSGERHRLLKNIEDLQQKRLEDNTSTTVGIFSNIYESLKTFFTETHDITLNILLQPLESHLAEIQPPAQLQQGHMQDMPAFSFAPQESITQIGQYLLTLPQHLEPLLLSPSTLLKQALEMCHIKYAQAIPSADILLSLVVAQCCVLYQSQILQIKSISNASSKQLAVDIEYLSSVVEELGLSLTTSLTQILTLLKASPENYLSLSAGCEPRLVTAIRQMRNIISTQ